MYPQISRLPSSTTSTTLGPHTEHYIFLDDARYSTSGHGNFVIEFSVCFYDAKPFFLKHYDAKTISVYFYFVVELSLVCGY
jgi:hypothetical protein